VTYTSFNSDPQMTSQNGICGMSFPLQTQPTPVFPSGKKSALKLIHHIFLVTVIDVLQQAIVVKTHNMLKI